MRRLPLLAAVLLTFSVDALTAQDPDTTQAPPPRVGPTLPDTVRADLPMGDTAVDRVPEYRHPRYAVSFSIGTFGFDVLQAQPVVARRIDALGTVLDSAAVRRSIGTDTGVQTGVGLLASLSPAWAIRLGAAIGRTELRTGYASDELLYERTLNALATSEVDVTVVLVEAALRLRIPASRRLKPYLEVGATHLAWDFGDAGPRAGLDTERRVAALAAVGGTVPVGRGIAVGGRVTSRLFRTPVEPRPEGPIDLPSSTLRLSSRAPEATPYADAGHELISELRFDLVVSVGFGGRPPPAADGSSEPSGR